MATQVMENGGGASYTISARLVHWGITSIISGIVVIGGYMIVWAINDSAWRARVTAEVSAIHARMEAKREDVEAITALRDQVRLNGIVLTESRDLLARIDERVKRLEVDHARLVQLHEQQHGQQLQRR